MTEAPASFFYDIAEIQAASIAQMVEGIDLPDDERQRMFDVFGRDLMTRVILQTSTLSVFHEEARPGERSEPHRHGTHQITYVLRGSLHYVEIHAGEPQLDAD